ncbi:hypothetical protein IJJ05_01520 [Candidatus Saccharibacteria bacterium]|nr:hypothetical protein [Candidatus Saccharibacteria bacterium]
MSRRLKGLLLVFGLAIVFGVVSGREVYARYDETQKDSCYSVYYSKDKSGKSYDKATVCQDEKGDLYVDKDDLNNYGPHFEISENAELCFAIPGGGRGCTPFLSGRQISSSLLMAAVENTSQCKVNGSSIECNYRASSGRQDKYYVSDNAESVSKPDSGESGGGSSGSSGTTVDPDGYSGTTGGLDDEPSDEDEVTCMNSGAAQSLGWIACVILDLTGKAAEKLYNYIEPNLVLPPRLFSDGGEVQGAWASFRDIANVLFVILLLFVIFSQLTGMGIDNYGIKKTLPKLIVAAILINLSYIICVLLVDISNIAGNGFQAMFDGLSSSAQSFSIEIPRADESGSYTAKIETSGKGLVTAGIVTALTATSAAVILNPAIVISLLVSIIGVLISFFFLFILLAAREAAIVVLVVISPLAVACYMLPNTKKLFDKWAKFFQGLLLVYPICGLLIGGGNFVSKLLLSSDSWLTGISQALTAMLVGILPIFFLPTVLKSSFAAMGTIGSKLAGFGERMSGGATRRMRGSEGYKGLQERGLERKTRIRAGINSEGGDSLSGKIRKKVGIGGRGMARARAQYLKDQDARNREKSLLGVGYDAAAIGLKKKAEKDETADYMTLINNETRNGEDTDRLYQMFDRYMDDGNKAGAVAVARIAGRRKDTADDFLSKKITGQSINKDTGEETLSNASSKYNRKALSSVMKEIATGENSGAYRSAAPMGFEFAADFNRNYREDENGNPTEGAGESNYEAWRNKSNVSRSMSNYVTNSRELIDVKNSSLREMNRLLNTPGAMDEGEVTRLRDLARDTIKNKNSGQLAAAWDTTKEENIYKMAYGGEWERRLGEDRKASGERISDATGSSSVERSSSGGGGLTEPLTPIADSGRSGAFSSEGEFRVRDIGDRLSSESRDSLVGGTGRTDGAGGARSSGESSR